MTHLEILGMPGNRDALLALCKSFHVRELDLFGSAAQGRFDRDRSDLDFLVRFEELASSESYFERYFGFQKGLAELFDRPVDLLTPPSLENPFLRQSVLETRRRLFPVE